MSTLTLWRLCPTRRIERAVSGDGAFRRGGRWNPPGVRVVYFAESRALAALEVLAGVDDTSRLALTAWVLVSATFPTELVEKPARVPASWRRYPHPPETQVFGAAWVRAARSAVLRVPSAMVPGEFNYLLNPAHPDFKRVKIGPPIRFSFDPRLAG